MPRSRLLLTLLVSSCPVFAQGNQALLVDGTGSHLLVNRDPSLEPTDQLTLECWIKAEGSVSHGRILRKENGSGYDLNWSFQGNQVSGYPDCGGRYEAKDPAPNSDYLGEWHHLALTIRTGGEVRLYIDAELVDSVPAPPTLCHSGDLGIGGRPLGGEEGFIGLIDEVRIWRIERTAEAIRRFYRTRVDPESAGLVSVWQMDGDGTDSVSGNDGALRGSATFVPAEDLPFGLSFAPAQGDWQGGQSVTIQSLEPYQSESPEVYFGGVPSPTVVKVDPKTLIAEVPPAPEPAHLSEISVVDDSQPVPLTAAAPYLYTPAILETSAIAGGTYDIALAFQSPTQLFLFIGVEPPPASLPVQSYGWFLEIPPSHVIPFFNARYIFQDRAELSFIVPPNPAFVGRRFASQALIGPTFDGRSASFTNVVSATVQ